MPLTLHATTVSQEEEEEERETKALCVLSAENALLDKTMRNDVQRELFLPAFRGFSAAHAGSHDSHLVL